MRWLVACVLLIAGTARAHRVVMEPPIIRSCRAAKSWPAVDACIKKQGASTNVVKQTQVARLVKFSYAAANRAGEGGYLLYVVKQGEWRLGGYWRTYGRDYDILGFERITVGKHVGYRIDIGQAQPQMVSIDGISPVMGLMRFKRTLFCGADYYNCPEAITSCEVLVHGSARYVFRGKLSYETDGTVLITGDRSKAGPLCTSSERIYLGWAQD